MKEIFINQVIIPLLGLLVSIILGLIAYFVRSFYNTHKNFLEVQRKWLTQKIGIDKYNQDVTTVKNMVYTVEQLGKEFDWEGTIKHSKVLEMVAGKTGLTDNDIFNIIKGTVAELNISKSTTQISGITVDNTSVQK